MMTLCEQSRNTGRRNLELSIILISNEDLCWAFFSALFRLFWTLFVVTTTGRRRRIDFPWNITLCPLSPPPLTPIREDILLTLIRKNICLQTSSAFICSISPSLQVLNKDAETLRIIHSNQEKIFEDEATIGDQEVNNDDVVFVVFRKGDSNDFETLMTGASKESQWAMSRIIVIALGCFWYSYVFNPSTTLSSFTAITDQLLYIQNTVTHTQKKLK